MVIIILRILRLLILVIIILRILRLLLILVIIVLRILRLLRILVVIVLRILRLLIVVVILWILRLSIAVVVLVVIVIILLKLLWLVVKLIISAVIAVFCCIIDGCSAYGTYFHYRFSSLNKWRFIKDRSKAILFTDIIILYFSVYCQYPNRKFRFNCKNKNRGRVFPPSVCQSLPIIFSSLSAASSASGLIILSALPLSQAFAFSGSIGNLARMSRLYS